jgi:D-alanyl-D-alanine carboxypeptidase
MMAAAAAGVIAIVLFGLLSSGGSADFPTSSCEGAACQPLVAADTQTPAPQPSASGAASPGATVGTAAAPGISGFGAAIIEAPCSARVFGLNEGMRLAPASLTKMMTAIVALDYGGLDDIVEVSIDGGELSLATDSTVMGLKPGDRLPLRDLIYGLLMRSGHDAAIAIAEHIAGDEATFAELMNDRAAALGLTQTNFSNASGLDDENLYTTAYDMAQLAAALLENEALAEVVRTKEYEPSWDRGKIENLNLMLNFYEGAVGVKTGFTDLAGQTIAAAADRDGRRLIVSVLHSEDLYVDASALLDWAFANTAPAC